MSDSADAAAAAPRRGPLSLDDLAARRGVKPVTSVQDMAVDGLFPDDELDEFIAQVRAWRQADTA